MVRTTLAWGLVVVALLTLVGCAAGTGSEWQKEDAEPANFWAGLWHGALLLVTLVVSFFTDQVSIYEAHNVGIGYEIGFVLGVLIVYGGSSRATCKKKPTGKAKTSEESWDEIGRGVEAKVKAKISAWVESEEEGGDQEDWREIGAKVEERLKERIRRWVAEEEAQQRDPGKGA